MIQPSTWKNYTSRYFVALLFIFSSCTSGGGRTSQSKEERKSDSSIIKANYEIFLETSGSMEGYLADNSEFYSDVTNLITDIKGLSLRGLVDTVRVNYLGSEIFKENKSAGKLVTDFNSKLNQGTLKPFQIKSSDFYRFFKQALDNVSESKVSVLITDLIFSPEKADQKKFFNNYLTSQSRGIQDLFMQKLNSLDFSTLILKCESNFDGIYFDYLEQKHKINTTRPYYIIFLGNSMFLHELADNVNYKHLAGYRNQCFLTTPLELVVNRRLIKSPSVRIGEYEVDRPAS